jgi:replicative DNA helicase
MSDVPPHDDQAERAVIGAVILGGVEKLDAVRGTGLQGSMFYQPRHETIWHACEALAARGEALDHETLLASLPNQQRGALAPYLPELIAEGSRPGALEWHARIIADAAVLRALAGAGERIIQLAQSAPLDRRREAVERARVALDLVEIPEEAAELAMAEDLLPAILDRIEDGQPRGIPTGIRPLDSLLGGGMGSGQSIVVAARPSVGKTMLGCNLAAAACREQVPTVFFSHEMTRDELMQRFLALEANVALTRIRAGAISEDEWGRIARATDKISKWPLFIDDSSRMTVADYRARMRKLARRRTVQLVVSDYLQLVKPEDPRLPREQQVASSSAGLKALAKDFGLPVVTLAQLGRGVEQRRSAKPVLSDLRESGSIENDADVVVLLHQPSENLVEAHVAKNRQGERGMVKLTWLPAVMRCSAYAEEWK